jgi:hypothetical protein
MRVSECLKMAALARRGMRAMWVTRRRPSNPPVAPTVADLNRAATMSHIK